MGARSSIKIIARGLSTEKIISAIKTGLKESRHLRVQIIFENLDPSISEDVEAVKELANAGAALKKLPSGNKTNIQTKFCTVDGEVSMNGAINWTKKDLRYTFDNMVLLRDQEAVQKFEKEFEYYWDNSDSLSRDDFVARRRSSNFTFSKHDEPQPRHDPFVNTNQNLFERGASTNQTGFFSNAYSGTNNEPDTNGESSGTGLLSMMENFDKNNALGLKGVAETVKTYIEPVNDLLDKVEQVKKLDASFEVITGQKLIPEEVGDIMDKVSDIQKKLN